MINKILAWFTLILGIFGCMAVIAGIIIGHAGLGFGGGVSLILCGICSAAVDEGKRKRNK